MKNHFTERGEMKAVLVLIGVLVFASAGTADEYFKWTDERGVVHITNVPSSVPEEYKGEAERRVMPAESEAPSGSTRESAGAMEEPTGEPKDRFGRGRDYWVSRTNEAKRRLSRAQGEYEGLRREYRDLRDAYNNTTSLAERDEYKKQMESVQVELRRRSEEIFRARELLERTLPAEAASAGAPAEWVQ